MYSKTMLNFEIKINYFFHREQSQIFFFCVQHGHNLPVLCSESYSTIYAFQPINSFIESIYFLYFQWPECANISSSQPP